MTAPAPNVALLTCVHPIYDLPRIARERENAIAALEQSGCAVVAAETLRTASEAGETAARLREARIDLAILFFCTWISENIPLAFTRELGDLPLLLWALPYLDRDIPMPSPITGLTATASNLRRIGTRFAHSVGPATAEQAQFIARAAHAAGVLRQLRHARFGLIGDPCPGMLDVETDSAAIHHALGATAVHIQLDALLNRSPADATDVAHRLIALSGSQEIPGPALAENLRLYLGIRELVAQHQLAAYCLRCWPELRDTRRITPCAAHALLSEDGIPNSCEVDLPALITTYILNRLAGAPAFNFDITAYLAETGAIQFAHCGAAAPSLARDPRRVNLRSHMRTGSGATVEFAFPRGRVTLAKLLRPANGNLRLFVARGLAIDSAGSARGSVATVRPEPSAAAFLDAMIRHGVEHHIALVYGDWTRELACFCEFAGIEIIR